jgi:glutamine amidotransferase/cyclase
VTFSEESGGRKGLGIISGSVTEFDRSSVSVPHIGWNGLIVHKESHVLNHISENDAVYFVHSFRAVPNEENKEWTLATTTYGEEGSPTFISAVQKGNVVACQFHPEKSGELGLRLLRAFLSDKGVESGKEAALEVPANARTQLTKRIVACLDVRTNDAGDLVVTKGDQYDVREAPVDDNGTSKGQVRALLLAHLASLPSLARSLSHTLCHYRLLGSKLGQACGAM